MEDDELKEEDFIKSPTTHDIDPNLYFEILEYLAKNAGVNIEKDITDLLSKHFKNKTLADIWWDLKSEDFEKYLKPMEEEKHVGLEFKTDNEAKGYRNGRGLAFATLKANGLLFYYQKLQVDSTISVNASIIESNSINIKNSRIQTYAFVAAALFAFGSLAVSVTDVYLKNHTKQDAKQKMNIKTDSLKLKMKTLKQRQI
ncbi:hypothetical protein [Mucilaginibacter sp. L196]|uniref:hypothetical protein n=1 Tax=Mucilaginibacter sp. L196 TaxID=1641870 RepID=UPI00131D6511|nr:hypothetical protein [Mucilaginibacter sp. L196]